MDSSEDEHIALTQSNIVSQPSMESDYVDGFSGDVMQMPGLLGLSQSNSEVDAIADSSAESDSLSESYSESDLDSASESEDNMAQLAQIGAATGIAVGVEAETEGFFGSLVSKGLGHLKRRR